MCSTTATPRFSRPGTTGARLWSQIAAAGTCAESRVRDPGQWRSDGRRDGALELACRPLRGPAGRAGRQKHAAQAVHQQGDEPAALQPARYGRHAPVRAAQARRSAQPAAKAHREPAPGAQAETGGGPRAACPAAASAQPEGACGRKRAGGRARGQPAGGASCAPAAPLAGQPGAAEDAGCGARACGGEYAAGSRCLDACDLYVQARARSGACAWCAAARRGATWRSRR
jgi:hypothetical protein